MAFSTGSGAGAPMADINVTPLVDVMLVLLIIFMVTAPALSYPIDINLPQKSINTPPNPVEPPPPVSLRIDQSGVVYWDNAPTPIEQVERVMRQVVERDPTNQPRLEIDVNDDAEYETLAKVLAYAKNAGMEKIGFVQSE